MLSNFEDQAWLSPNNFKGIQNGGQGIIELDINNSTDDGDNSTSGNACSGRRGGSLCAIMLAFKFKDSKH